MTEIEIRHDSDCAQHNEPAYPNGPCDCSARDGLKATAALEACSVGISALRGNEPDKSPPETGGVR